MNRFWSALLRAAESWEDVDGFSFRPYFLNDRHLDVPAHRTLCADLADGGLAGVLVVSSPHWLVGSPVLDADIPRVCIGSVSPQSVAKYRASYLNMGDSGIEPAVLQRFRSAGRKRVAFITHPSYHECPWLPCLREIGLETRPEWWLGMSPNYPEGARPIARLLCSWPVAQRPDCMLITDDNLVSYATAGVLDAGVHPPQDMLVAAHANFPYPTHAAFTCLRFGVDVVAMLRAGIAEIVRLGAGGTPGSVLVERIIREQAIA